MTVLLVSLQDYVQALTGVMNTPLSLGVLLSPFGISAPAYDQPSTDLVTGFFIDDLVERFAQSTEFDPLDIASEAWDMGFGPAGTYLDEGPDALFQVFVQAMSHAR